MTKLINLNRIFKYCFIYIFKNIHWTNPTYELIKCFYKKPNHSRNTNTLYVYVYNYNCGVKKQCSREKDIKISTFSYVYFNINFLHVNINKMNFINHYLFKFETCDRNLFSQFRHRIIVLEALY